MAQRIAEDATRAAHVSAMDASIEVSVKRVRHLQWESGTYTSGCSLPLRRLSAPALARVFCVFLAKNNLDAAVSGFDVGVVFEEVGKVEEELCRKCIRVERERGFSPLFSHLTFRWSRRGSCDSLDPTTQDLVYTTAQVCD